MLPYFFISAVKAALIKFVVTAEINNYSENYVLSKDSGFGITCHIVRNFKISCIKLTGTSKCQFE